MTSSSSLSQTSGRTGVRCDWDVKEQVGTGTVDGVFELGEKARGLTVAAPATRGTRGSGGRLIQNVPANGVFPFPESRTVPAGGGASVSELR